MGNSKGREGPTVVLAIVAVSNIVLRQARTRPATKYPCLTRIPKGVFLGISGAVSVSLLGGGQV